MWDLTPGTCRCLTPAHLGRHIHKQTMSIQQIRNNYMVVDPLTKGLALKVFNEHVEK